MVLRRLFLSRISEGGGTQLPQVHSDEGESGKERPSEYLDLEGEGVSVAEFERWESAKNRFLTYGTNKPDDPVEIPNRIGSQYFSANTRTFLSGENILHAKSKTNLTNNPLRLIRPKRVQSFPKFSHRKRSVGGLMDHAKHTAAKEYLTFVQQLEHLCVLALSHAQNGQGKEAFKAALDLAFTPAENNFGRESIEQIKSDQSAAQWLFFVVLSILDNPSEAIAPVGRVRVLELLSLFDAKEMADSITDKKRGLVLNGYDECHIPRIPHTFASHSEQGEGNISELREMWEKNQKMTALIHKKVTGKLDNATTFNGLTEKYPEEAIQIALLMLHKGEYVEDTLIFLQSVPGLDRRTLGRMFGTGATFLAQHKLDMGKRDEVQRALGMAVDPRHTVAIGDTRGELIQGLRRKEVALSNVERELAQAEVEINKLRWEIIQKDRIIKLLQDRDNKDTKVWIKLETMTRVLDPKRYYRVLNLHPKSFEDKDETSIEKLVKRMYRFAIFTEHPDQAEDDGERAKLLNNAKDCFLDPMQRERYGK